jgi:hypothetical protein
MIRFAIVFFESERKSELIVNMRNCGPRGVNLFISDLFYFLMIGVCVTHPQS